MQNVSPSYDSGMCLVNKCEGNRSNNLFEDKMYVYH